MRSAHLKPAGVIFLVGGIILIFMAILSSVYSYFYFQDKVSGIGSNVQLAQEWPLIIFETILICTVLGLLGGLAIGTYVQAWRAKKGQASTSL
jgi:hypothetical protein